MFEVTQQEYYKVIGKNPSEFVVPTSVKFKRQPDLIVGRKVAVSPLTSSIKEAIGTEIAALDGVELSTAGLIDFVAVAEGGDDPVVIQGVPAESSMLKDLEIVQGERLAATHQDARSVLIGKNLAKHRKLKTGDSVTINEVKFRIVGVFQSDSDIENSMALMLLNDAQRVCGKMGRITGVAVHVKDKSPDGIKAIQARIEGAIANKVGLAGQIEAKRAAVYDRQRTQIGRDYRFPPVENVSWNDAQEFCRQLSALPAEKAAGRRYRLPTEAEWEYSARAGTCQDVVSELDDTAWYVDNAYSMTHSVGQKAPNAFGLFDVYGNVAEWCSDGFAPDYYSKSSAAAPHGPVVSKSRVIRGGSWSQPATVCRPAARSLVKPDERRPDVGFRVVLEMSTGTDSPR